MIKNPKISVIIPIYNTSKYLKYCIESVLNQDYKNVEVLLVNDGSTDNSGKICENYKDAHKRVKVIHQNNSGASTARNKGLDHATGDYIMFLDSDDFWVDSCLGRIVDKLNKIETEIDVMFLKSAVIKDDGSLTEFKGYEFENFNKRQLIEYISTQNKVAVSACLKVINKKVFLNKNLYFKDSLLVEDIDWFFNLINIANKFTTFDGDFYCYRIRSDSASRTPNEQRIRDYLYILNKWANYTKNSTDIDKHFLYYMIGYEYEILLSTFFDYDKKVQNKYYLELKKLSWLLNYRDKPRSRMIKVLNRLVGFKNTCLILNAYLKKRKRK